jgi:Mg2+ and Co2+ transporter CorA
MKQVNLTLPGLFKNLGLCVFMVVLASLFAGNLNAQSAYGLPSLKSADQAASELMSAYNAILPQAKQAGQGSQLMNTAELYLKMVDALTNRSDRNMDTYSVLISGIDVNHYSNLVVRNGNSLDMDATIRKVLNTPEYQSMVAVIRQ